MRFFFYGTLTAQCDNEVARRLHGLLKPGMPATTRGRLYAIEDEQGWYPGLIPDPEGGIVHGFLHEAGPGFGGDDLAVLDAYENFDPLRPDCSEFVRQAICIEAACQASIAMAYVLGASPSEDMRVIPDGDFAGFVAAAGLRPYGAQLAR